MFACVDIDHAVVAWGAYRGILVSARSGHEYPKCPVSVMFAGMLKHRNSARLRNELAIERIRQLKHPDRTSRLIGMYFFEEQSALTNATSWGAHFLSKYFVEVEPLPGAKFSRHDANWITYAPCDPFGNLTRTDWADEYWSGESFPGANPTWEFIVDGRVAIFGTKLREQAYQNIKSEFPESVAILEIARISAEIGSDLGQINAWLIQSSETNYSLQYYLDMRDADHDQFLEKLKNYGGPRNIADLAVGGDHFTVPDLRRLGEKFDIKEPFSQEIFRNVHT